MTPPLPPTRNELVPDTAHAGLHSPPAEVRVSRKSVLVTVPLVLDLGQFEIEVMASMLRLRGRSAWARVDLMYALPVQVEPGRFVASSLNGVLELTCLRAQPSH